MNYNPVLNKAFYINGNIDGYYWGNGSCDVFGLARSDKKDIGGINWGFRKGYGFNQEFDKGIIYDYEKKSVFGSTKYKLHVIEPILSIYSDNGLQRGSYGYPVGNAVNEYDGICQDFEGRRLCSYGTIIRSIDSDHDGMLDSKENELAMKYAPVLILSADEKDYPANIRYFYENSSMYAYQQDGVCNRLVDGNIISQEDLLDDRDVRRKKLIYSNGIYTFKFCKKQEGYIYSVHNNYDSDRFFYLDINDNKLGKYGVYQDDFNVYTRVYWNDMNGISIQYWFFYLNDRVEQLKGAGNHEGDWEHIVVNLDQNENPVSVFFAQHNDGSEYEWNDIEVDGTHPYVYVARGTHASYPTREVLTSTNLAIKGFPTEVNVKGGDKINTINKLENMGERNWNKHALQRFIYYTGKWGEVKLEKDILFGELPDQIKSIFGDKYDLNAIFPDGPITPSWQFGDPWERGEDKNKY